MINQKIIKKLEFDKIQDMVADLTLFEGGAAKAHEMMPVSNFDSVNKRLDETDEAMEALRFGEPSFLGGLRLLNRQFAKARIGGVLSGDELRDVYRLLHASHLAKNYIQKGKYPVLTGLLSALTEERELEYKIERAISEDGQLKDDASPELRNLRNQINTIRTRIKEYLQNFIRSADNQKILQEALVTEREGRYVVPVKQENRGAVKGIVHDESASGATVYIEPLPVVELNNRLRSVQMEEKREVERILRSLSSSVAVMVDDLHKNQELLALMDFIFARARLAYKLDAYRPITNVRGIIEISRAKHPLLGEKAVPIDVELGRDFDTLVITGPNTGGKTVVLKTIGLLVLMTMSGLFIPAREKSRIAVFDSIFVDIGDEQSIEQSLSTFSAHMKNIINIINESDRRSLVLLDELGAGTDPAEGAALGRVILDELRSKGAKVVVTTHQSELKYYAYQTTRVENACVEFDPISLQPTYKLTIGMPGQSNAFEIAIKLGMEKNLVQKARELVPAKEIEVGNMIKQLKESHYSLNQENQEVQRIKEEILRERELLEKRKIQVEEERQEILAKVQEDAAREIRRIKQEASEALAEFKELLKDKEKPPKWHEIEEKRQKIKNIKMQTPVIYRSEVSNNQDIKEGDYVLIKSLNQKGHVLTINEVQDEVNVQVGSIKFYVNRDSLVKLDEPVRPGIKWRGESFLDKARKISKEIDLRGQHSDDAIMEIDRYLADAILVGLDSVRLIHGKGTGALRIAVRNYLKNHPQVKNYRDGLPEEGGNGVTVVEFK